MNQPLVLAFLEGDRRVHVLDVCRPAGIDLNGSRPAAPAVIRAQEKNVRASSGVAEERTVRIGPSQENPTVTGGKGRLRDEPGSPDKSPQAETPAADVRPLVNRQPQSPARAAAINQLTRLHNGQHARGKCARDIERGKTERLSGVVGD